MFPTPTEAPRLSKQCREILARLRSGRATNNELAQIALKYTGRISDIRKGGHDIRVLRQDRATGVTVYALFEGGKEVE